MTVEELINKLKQFPMDIEVVDDMYLSIENVYESIWVDSNYPYDRPDKPVIVLS